MCELSLHSTPYELLACLKHEGPLSDGVSQLWNTYIGFCLINTLAYHLPSAQQFHALQGQCPAYSN
jgi:hypothetical protein